MPTEQDFINAINAADDWRPPALTFTDWLRERGDSERATLLAQCANGDYEQSSHSIIDNWLTNGKRQTVLSNLASIEIFTVAADFAERVLRFFENVYPQDDRPRTAIAATREYASAACEHDTSTAKMPRRAPTYVSRAAGDAGLAAGIAAKSTTRATVAAAARMATVAAVLAANAAARAAFAVAFTNSGAIADAAETAARHAAAASSEAAAQSVSRPAYTARVIREERQWQASNYLLQLHFGPNDWLIRQHRKELSP